MKETKKVTEIKNRYIQLAFEKVTDVFEEEENESGCEMLTFDQIEDIIRPFITKMVDEVYCLQFALKQQGVKDEN